MDYLTLLLETYINEREIFTEVLKNRQKQIENEKSISKKEFYFNCDKVINELNLQLSLTLNNEFENYNKTLVIAETKNDFDTVKIINAELEALDKTKVSVNLLHSTKGKIPIHLFLKDIKFIENCIYELKFISQAEKDQIFKEMVFEKGLFYFSDTNKKRIKQAYEKLENSFETEEDFIRAVNSLLHSNGLYFYNKLRTISNETEFIKYIQSQYDLYNEYTPNNSLNWLNFTKKAVMYGFGILRIENESLKASFMNWYNERVKTLTPEKTKPMENNVYDKVINELDLVKQIFYSQIINENNNWNQIDEGRYCNHLYINSNEDLFELSKYKNYYTNRIDNSNSALLKNELEEIYRKAITLWEYFLKELKDHKDKREVYVGEDAIKQITESSVLFIVRKTKINYVSYNYNYDETPFTTFTKEANTKKCTNENLASFCVQLLKFIDLTGVLEQVQVNGNKQNRTQQTEIIKNDEVINLHPKHNPNDWNKDCFELFKYLFDEYYNDKKKTNTKLMCVWFYLSEYKTEKYKMRIKKDDYITFIKQNYKITITNKDKPDNYDSKVFNTLEEHRIKFEDSLK